MKKLTLEEISKMTKDELNDHGYWVDKNGKAIHVNAMDYYYLRNAIKFADGYIQRRMEIELKDRKGELFADSMKFAETDEVKVSHKDEPEHVETIEIGLLDMIISDEEMAKVHEYLNRRNKLPKRGQRQAICDGGYESSMYGSFYINTEPPTIKRFNFEYKVKSNNVAEYMALIALLKYLAGLRITSIDIYTDSQLVVNQVNGDWGCKAEHLQPLLAEVNEILKNFTYVKLEWRRRDLAVEYLGH